MKISSKRKKKGKKIIPQKKRGKTWSKVLGWYRITKSTRISRRFTRGRHREPVCDRTRTSTGQRQSTGRQHRTASWPETKTRTIFRWWVCGRVFASSRLGGVNVSTTLSTAGGWAAQNGGGQVLDLDRCRSARDAAHPLPHATRGQNVRSSCIRGYPLFIDNRD